ncbi:MAG: hypothetical protein KIT83_13145 [Bryobacterales bacterium]|nr:hypothetical protein [Bryobacterales bacterium]
MRVPSRNTMLRILYYLAFALAVPAALFAQPARPLEIQPDLPTGPDAGVCLLRLNVAGSADIILEGEKATFRTRAGTLPIDAGSVCSAGVPRQPLDHFRVDRIRGKGRVLLVENPADRNQFQAWIRIDNESVAPDFYELRVSWRENDDSGPEGRNELRLVPRGTPARWVPPGADISAGSMAGRPLSSYDNDPLRYDTNAAGSLEFRGQVDDVMEFLVRGDRLHVVLISGQQVKVERFRFTQPLPSNGPLTAVLEKKDGRGTVELVEEPSAANAYTARIRVADPQAGADRYHWVISWRR